MPLNSKYNIHEMPSKFLCPSCMKFTWISYLIIWCSDTVGMINELSLAVSKNRTKVFLMYIYCTNHRQRNFLAVRHILHGICSLLNPQLSSVIELSKYPSPLICCSVVACIHNLSLSPFVQAWCFSANSDIYLKWKDGSFYIYIHNYY